MTSSPEKPKLKRAGTMVKTAIEGEEFLSTVGHEITSGRETRGFKRTQEVVEDMLSSKKFKPQELNEEDSEKLRAQLKMIFRLFDGNNDKKIDRTELRNVIRSIGKRPSAQKIDQIMKEADTDGNGTINEDEFIAYMLKKRSIKLALSPEEKERRLQLKKERERARRQREKEKLARTKESREREKKLLMKRLKQIQKEEKYYDESDEDYKPTAPRITTKTTTPSKEKEKEKEKSPPKPLKRGHSIADFYTEFAGLHDEINPKERDVHSNPVGREYDLGREGTFNIFTILVGLFCEFNMQEAEFRKNAGKALEEKGFIVEVTTDERKFLQRLEHIDVSSAWIISGSKMDIYHDEFGRAIKAFRERGRGVAIWADNDPWTLHASVSTQFLAKVKLVGNTPGDKNLKVGDAHKPGHFRRHLLTTGLEQLYEGITICYPEGTDGLEVLATSSNGKACMAFIDHDSHNPQWGRVVVDCGFTKLYHHWDSAGTGRYVRNVAVWLLGLEHRIRMNYPISGPVAY